MKPSTEEHFRHEGNLGAGRREMTIDQENIGIVIDHLTDLYGDQEGAIIREYPANAQDSHNAKGTTEPIEITLPTHQDPTFIVKDHGVGMSVDQVYNDFAKYGWSSKRETNTEVGMMGLGCKAALTHAQQFTLITIKDGVQATVNIDRGKNGIPGIEVVDTVSTDEPSGVTVMVPIRTDLTSFRNKADYFFSHWEPGTVLVDGEEPERITGTWIDDSIVLTERRHDVIVMGGIPYEVEDSKSITRSVRSCVTVFVPIGSVDPTTSREGLRYTKRTMRTLDAAQEFINERVTRMAQEEIDAAATPTEAVKVRQRWRETIGGTGKSFTYRGQKFPATFEVPVKWRYYTHGDWATKHDYQHFQLGELTKATWVTGHPTKTVSPRQRGKLLGLLRGENIVKNDYVYLVDELPTQARYWADPEKVYAWDEVEATEPVLRMGTTPRPNTKRDYVIMSEKGRIVYREVAPNNARTIYASTGDDKDDYKRAVLHFFTRLVPEYEVVLMHPRSFGKFHREHPKTISMEQAIIKEFKALKRRLGPIEQAAISHRASREYQSLQGLAKKDLLDPDLDRLVKSLRRVVKGDLTYIHSQLDNAARHYSVNVHKYRPSIEGADEIAAILGRYPLLGRIRGTASVQEVQDYVNGLYLLRAKERDE